MMHAKSLFFCLRVNTLKKTSGHLVRRPTQALVCVYREGGGGVGLVLAGTKGIKWNLVNIRHYTCSLLLYRVKCASVDPHLTSSV